jgi:hypothetical protein
MNFSTTQRKPRLYFDTVSNPSHVTFDDGHAQRRNFSWVHFAEARVDYNEPDFIKLSIGEWLVELQGNNMEALFEAIETQSLLRVRAQPHLSADREKAIDCFVTKIRFLVPPAATAQPKKIEQGELSLGAC